MIMILKMMMLMMMKHLDKKHFMDEFKSLNQIYCEFKRVTHTFGNIHKRMLDVD